MSSSKACLRILFRELLRSQQNIHEKVIYRSTSKNDYSESSEFLSFFSKEILMFPKAATRGLLEKSYS